MTSLLKINTLNVYNTASITLQWKVNLAWRDLSQHWMSLPGPQVLLMMPCMLDPRDLASAIRELRGKRTQREVAERAQIDPATWSAYEQGTRYPRRPERLRQIAEGLGVNFLDLQNAILQQSVFRLSKEQSREMPSESPNCTTALQIPTDVNEVRRLVEEQVAELSRHLTKLILLLIEGRPRNP